MRTAEQPQALRELVIAWRDEAVGCDRQGDYKRAGVLEQCADALAALLDAHAAAPPPAAAGTWQPMSTAPRDGTAILVTDGEVQRVAWTQHPAEHGDQFKWCYHITRGGAYTVMANPIAWQPLPPAPRPEGGPAEGGR